MLEAVREKLAELERMVTLSRSGRAGEAVQIVRAGAGRTLMVEIRGQIAAIDEIEVGRLDSRRRQSEYGSRLTIAANALRVGTILAERLRAEGSGARATGASIGAQPSPEATVGGDAR